MYVKFTTVYNAEIKYTETYQSGDIPIYGQIVINQNVLSVFFFFNIVLLIKQVLLYTACDFVHVNHTEVELKQL